MNETNEESKRLPIVVRCYRCPDPGYECSYCDGNGTVWQDQDGKRIYDLEVRPPNCFNWDSFNFQTMNWDE